MSQSKPTDQVTIFDTTLRDGEQAPGFHLGPDAKLQVAQQLHRLGVDVIEAGFPVSSPAEFEAVQQIAKTVGQATDAPQICGLARCVEGDIKAVADAVRPARRPRIHVFIATSDIHLEHKLRMSREEMLERAVRSVRFARQSTDNVEFSAEDASRTDREFLARVVQSVIEAGATTVNIPDTVGYAQPAEYGELIAYLFREVPNIDRVVVSVHGQDDLGLSVANTLAAVKAGARQVEVTVNGIGERAGNTSLEEVVMALHTRRDYYGVTTNIRTQELTKASRLLAALTDSIVPPNKAIVGSNAFAHGSGVHQDGMLKHPETYEIIRPETVGSEGSRLLLTARSGKNAVVNRLRELGIKIVDTQADDVYRRFKNFADHHRFVVDADLVTLAKE